MEKGFTMFVYDFKFDDLTRIAYNVFLKNRKKYKNKPSFYVINFDDLQRTHRCNPLEPSQMVDITDASESARSILLALNKEWVKKSGEFFTESAVIFVTAVIWWLRKYKNGLYCTLAHVIELISADYDDLFPVLGTEPECESLIQSFISAYLNRALEQLEGQIASARIALARLSSPTIYYVISGNDFTLDINNPEAPKVVCVGNNPSKTQTYGAVLSLYTNRLLKQVNQKGKLKSSLIFDEYPTIYQPLDYSVSVSRSNLVSHTICIQDYSQMKKDYSREQAEVLMNVCGNIISGQVLGDTAKMLSERIGKIVQERESISINRNDTSISRSTQMDSAIPPSKISALSSGEFVGQVADDPMKIVKLKNFHSRIINDHSAIKQEEAAYKPLPIIRHLADNEVDSNYIRIKNDVAEIIESEILRIKSDPDLVHLLFVKSEHNNGHKTT
ncbi:type IV secretory system conjugative DNA transfer family protein [Chitinophaga sp. LS1]|uniref:type IV secretory system conjugative DNA transfer family protein n=1 Tax=Chitinophaga sp. LS1 TaxID=3051176 RepID=UPI002AAA6A5C|nr:type IV secretory system conjugative DNA transfer family protein [Chitinophaga sp. LS1]WPV67549.1 type IV secretory system conjugative DNA transfer family protein [Chitinophaga sp. LS1]